MDFAVVLLSPHRLFEYSLGVLAVLLLLSGLDDLVPATLCVWDWFRRKAEEPVPARSVAKRRIAIFVPCWREADVIASMVRHNLAAIRYQKFDFFLGVYPNDTPTLEVTGALAKEFRRVHVLQCPYEGPTSKADCLNWIYQGMLVVEEKQGIRFDTIVVHDAEDLIHPEALSLINTERSRYDMVQVPVLPLPTPIRQFTHGTYCDDFAEYQMLDMRARQISGSFIPSNGVGTAYGRLVLERLAKENNSVIFEPDSLTEDYESGIRIHALGYSQVFCRLRKTGAEYVATREFFPRTFGSAVKQRTRWVSGIALQSWERNRWHGPWLTKYWFWRDRKGLLTNIVGIVTNLFFAIGLLSWIWSKLTGQPWPLRVESPVVIRLSAATLGLQCFRLALRMECVRRIFGFRFAAFAPLRAFHGNLINALATVRAVYKYVDAKLRGEALAWLKTEHAYPGQEALRTRFRTFSEVLAASGLITARKFASAERNTPRDADLADYIVHAGLLKEERLPQVLGLKEGMPSLYLDPRKVNPNVAHVLPAKVAERLQIIPFKVERGRLLVAGAHPPKEALREALRKVTKLDVEFYLVTWRNFEELRSLVA
jgi:bacteriophage N4 adsorption protein B